MKSYVYDIIDISKYAISLLSYVVKVSRVRVGEAAALPPCRPGLHHDNLEQSRPGSVRLCRFKFKC
jgi:hypothetical protein